MDVLRIYNNWLSVNMLQYLQATSQKESKCVLWRNRLSVKAGMGNQEGNAGNQGWNVGNQVGNGRNQGGNAGIRMGTAGNHKGNVGNQGGNAGNQVGMRVYKYLAGILQAFF